MFSIDSGLVAIFANFVQAGVYAVGEKENPDKLPIVPELSNLREKVSEKLASISAASSEG